MEIKTTETDTEKWQREALTGDAPFTDGYTAEVAELHKARADADAQRKAKRVQKYKEWRRELLTPAMASARKRLKNAEFNNSLTADEFDKVLVMRQATPQAKELRKGVSHTLLYYIRANFCAGGQLCVVVMQKNIPREAASVFRIADMARALFWKYRKPGCYGQPMSDEFFNLSLSRAQEDIAANPDIVAALEDYKGELLRAGVFSDNLAEVCAERPSLIRQGKRWRVDTCMKRMDELATKFEELKSGVVTQHGVTINALNVAQKQIAELAARVAVLAEIELRQMTPYTPPQEIVPVSPADNVPYCGQR